MNIQPSINPTQSKSPNNSPSVVGLGGWFVFIIIGEILAVISNVISIFILIPDIGVNSKFDMYVYFSIGLVLISIFISAAILYLIYTRNIFFRILFIVQIAIGFTCFIASFIFHINGWDISQGSNSYNITWPIIWVIYLYKSKRVKNTFIHGHLNKK